MDCDCTCLTMVGGGHAWMEPIRDVPLWAKCPLRNRCDEALQQQQLAGWMSVVDDLDDNLKYTAVPLATCTVAFFVLLTFTIASPLFLTWLVYCLHSSTSLFTLYDNDTMWYMFTQRTNPSINQSYRRSNWQLKISSLHSLNWNKSLRLLPLNQGATYKSDFYPSFSPTF